MSVLIFETEISLILDLKSYFLRHFLGTTNFYHCSMYNLFVIVCLKALRLGQGVYRSVTTGHVVNLISTDTQSFDRVRFFYYFLPVIEFILDIIL